MIKLTAILLLSAFTVLAANLSLNRETKKMVVGEQSYSIVENPEYLIAPGTYTVILSYSPRFQQVTPEIIVPGRVGLRIHVVKHLNSEHALQGCIGMLREDYNDLLQNLDKKNVLEIK